MIKSIESSFLLLLMLNFATAAFKITGCGISVTSLYGIKPKNRILSAVLPFCGAAVIAYLGADGAVRPDGPLAGLSGVFVPVCFFTVILFVFFSSGTPRIFLLSFCYDLLSGALKYILLMFSGFDWLDPGIAEDMLFSLASDLLLFAAALLFYLLYARKNKEGVFTLIAQPGMIVLLTVTLAVFTVTMVVLGENNAAEKRGEFLLCLVNIPLFTCTVVYAVKTVTKAKLSEESYRRNLDMQVRHYEIMDRKNDEMRIFRHDLPKKLGPLLLFAEQGDIDEVRNIIAGFNAAIETARPHYTTGNYRLDTVLECERQTAEKNGVSIEWTAGSVFPSGGIDADDIYTIFPNALDNAIEAAAKTAPPAVIRISSKVTDGTVYIRISNPFDGGINADGGTLKTVKEDKNAHGWGYKSIKKAAARYGSDNVRFETAGGVFNLYIEMKMK